MIEVASRLSIDIAVIGAGPQALTLVTHLFQKRKGWGDRIRVFDFNSTWLNQWQHQFAALEIPHLRSPAVHHPDPNPFALRTIHCQGEQILIIGSGLTSGHLAIGAVKRGARVTMMARRTFYEKFFDADPGWLGPKYLKGFRTETCWKKRWQIVMEARNGGSLTPAVMTQLRRLKAEGKIQLIENCQVQQALWDGNTWNIKCSDGEVLKCDRLWLATGTTINVEQQPLLSQMTKKHPIPLINGLPILTSHLRWGDRELYLMGGLSALQVGPTARNLSGARMATERIVEALIKPRSYDPLGQFKI